MVEYVGACECRCVCVGGGGWVHVYGTACVGARVWVLLCGCMFVFA